MRIPHRADWAALGGIAPNFLIYVMSFVPAAYGGILLMPAIAYYLLQKAILRKREVHALLATALGSDFKGKISPILFAAGIRLAFINPWISIAIYILVNIMWIIPDQRIELVLREG